MMNMFGIRWRCETREFGGRTVPECETHDIVQIKIKLAS